MNERDRIKKIALVKLDEAVSAELQRLIDGGLPLKLFSLQCEEFLSEVEKREVWPSIKRLNTPGYISFYCFLRGISSPIIDRYYKKYR